MQCSISRCKNQTKKAFKVPSAGIVMEKEDSKLMNMKDDECAIYMNV
jgi:hypothetical protein